MLHKCMIFIREKEDYADEYSTEFEIVDDELE